MRYAKIIIGVILLIKGIKAVIALPAAISAVHAVAGTPAYTAGHTAGVMVGLVIGPLAVLIGGAILLANGLTSFGGRNGPAPAA
jgi:hypothetical protein